jgi:hypothetical protein
LVSTSQGQNSVAIGTYSGQTNQGLQSVAIGYQAGKIIKVIIQLLLVLMPVI